MKEFEILSPAGDEESLKTAINNGANAVYLGLKDFNARGNIENFALEDLKKITSFAHLFNVKVYLTLNILVKDDEFDAIKDLVKVALESYVDAFIVQDIGLIYFLRKNFPNIELHASTQMGLQNLEGVQTLKGLNIKRVVLARETPLSEIKRISQNSDVELEYFVQGALCVAFSGNCYLCSLLADSSGNRGKCKQFCRLKYACSKGNDEEKGYLLSTKDFCMLPYLKNLAESGVTSFKIEGRARRPAYVAVSTAIYRKAVDNNYKFTSEDVTNLKKVYNRGDYISGYFANEKIIFSKAQNHIGIEIGKVTSVKKGKRFNEIEIKSTYEISKGDTVKFFSNGKECGIITLMDLKKINANSYLATTTAEVRPNSEVRLVIDKDFEEQYLENQKQIEVDVIFKAIAGEKANLTLQTKQAEVTIESDFIVERAKTQPLDERQCQNQIEKMGNIFYLKSFKAHLENAFLTKAELNNLRREGLRQLEDKIIISYNKKENLDFKSKYANAKIVLHNEEVEKEDIYIFDDFDKIDKIDKDKMLIYKPENYDERIIELYQKYSNRKIYISLPVMITKPELEKIQYLLSECSNWGVVANNYYALNLVAKDKTILGSNMNVYNSYAVKYYVEQGYKNIILSQEEIDLSKIKNSGANLLAYSKYHPEYMYFRHCPIKEHFKGDCKNCKYTREISYKLNNNSFTLSRQKIITCQFILKSKEVKNNKLPDNINKIIEI